MLGGTDNFRIGERNIRAARQYLAEHGFGVRHGALAGSQNRSLHLELATGSVALKSPGGNEAWSLAA
jgi:chemotaxis protein CheD